MIRYRWLPVLFLIALPSWSFAQDKAEIQAALNREIIGPRWGEAEVQEYLEGRVPRMPQLSSVKDWEKQAERIRADVLERVVYRGEAVAWRDARTKVEWLEEIPGGPGYRIKKLRYEALPGLWVPALLYEPDKLSGKVPVHLAVNGHERIGKAAKYKQVRCINLAKRGMLALNVEWLGMGQLRTDGYHHGRMNQLDLCGTSGLAPFYLAMKRGLDLLLAHQNADAKRVAVSGLSGGGWQTIIISSLDPRVTLANPVAGYSSFLTRVRHLKDLGDSEQTPNDLAAIADYTHLTALLAPRPTLLTYNSKDECCFEAGYALPPLQKAAAPVFKLYGKEAALRSHVNGDPGTHNFEKDNRQAFYRMVGDHFYPGNAKYDPTEIPSDDEVKTAEELAVKLPEPNADFHTLATALSKRLPRGGDLPAEKALAPKWQRDGQTRLREIVRAKDYQVQAEKMNSEEKGDVRITFWRLKMSDAWKVPAVEFVKGEPKGTTLVVADEGRRSTATVVERLLKEGKRVVALDPFYFGESKIATKDWLFAILIAAVGDRPLGIQASQVAAAARWLTAEGKGGPVTVVAVGPRSCPFALVAAGLEPEAIAGLELHQALGSLKEVIEKNHTVNQMPELFCFGLLEAFDVKQLVALSAPRPVRFVEPSERARTELSDLKRWYGMLGKGFDPLP